MSSPKIVLGLLLAVCYFGLVFSACEKAFNVYTSCLNQRSQATINAMKAEMKQMRGKMAALTRTIGGKNDGCVSGIKSTSYDRHPNLRETLFVSFGKRFSKPPAVSYGLVHMDTSKHKNVRIKTFTVRVTTTGFTFRTVTWGGSHTYMLKFSWMACPKK